MQYQGEGGLPVTRVAGDLFVLHPWPERMFLDMSWIAAWTNTAEFAVIGDHIEVTAKNGRALYRRDLLARGHAIYLVREASWGRPPDLEKHAADNDQMKVWL